MKIVGLFNIKLEQEMRNLACGDHLSAGFHYRGWILGIRCFRLTSLEVYQ